MARRRPICSECCHLDHANTSFLREAFGDAGLRMRSVWCGATDRPEDARWERCAIAEREKER